jgi:hypothetical protein
MTSKINFIFGVVCFKQPAQKYIFFYQLLKTVDIKNIMYYHKLFFY